MPRRARWNTCPSRLRRVEAGPNIAAPSPDDTWLPGCWVWQQGRYAWRPGFWAAAQPDWDWVPAHYVWAPRGYVFVDGYWDYSIGRRGVLFAPVYFDAGVYAQQGFSYSPTTVINPAVFANHLFLRPQYQHYYFGDYYAANYQAAGFYPCIRTTPAVSATIRFTLTTAGSIGRTADGSSAKRPTSRTAAITRMCGRRAPGRPRENSTRVRCNQERGVVMAAPLDHLTRSKDSPLRFQPVDQSERRKFAQQGQDSNDSVNSGKSWKQRGGRVQPDAYQGIRAGQSETSRISDCGEARRWTWKGHAPPKCTRLRNRIPRSCPKARASRALRRNRSLNPRSEPARTATAAST